MLWILNSYGLDLFLVNWWGKIYGCVVVFLGKEWRLRLNLQEVWLFIFPSKEWEQPKERSWREVTACMLLSAETSISYPLHSSAMSWWVKAPRIRCRYCLGCGDTKACRKWGMWFRRSFLLCRHPQPQQKCFTSVTSLQPEEWILVCPEINSSNHRYSLR